MRTLTLGFVYVYDRYINTYFRQRTWWMSDLVGSDSKSHKERNSEKVLEVVSVWSEHLGNIGDAAIHKCHLNEQKYLEDFHEMIATLSNWE